MEFVSPIIAPIVRSLLVPVKKHLGFLVSSTHNVKKMDARMKQLNDIAQEIQDKRDKAVENTEVVPERVEPWLKDVESLNERSNLIEATGCFNVTKRYKAGKESYNILEEIQDLKTRESEIKFTGAQKPLAEVGSTSTWPSTSSSVPMDTQNNFESRVLIFNDALQALQSNKESQRMIALCGMAGVGKTTMMEQLKKTVEDSKMFDSIIKVVIGEHNDPNSLQKDIAEYIGKKLDETTKYARAERLQKIFEKKSHQGQKKILVIIDDLWKEVDLTDVGLSPLPNGFKLLFTSRFENVCTQMGVANDSIFRVGVLNDTEAKNLFSRIVGSCPSDGDDDELQRVRENIVKKCGGLPIAIVTIAKFLRGKKMEAWQKALWRLERDDLKDLEKIAHRIFDMSYENLEEDVDKAIFLLSGLFPDDFNIRTEDLLRYGWGLNFFKNARTLAIARSDMQSCVDNLIGANLLSESDVNGCVRMHDLVRAFVLTNLSKVKQASIVNHDSMSLEGLSKDLYERILLKCTSMCGFPTGIDYPNLSLLILMDGYGFFNFPEDLHNRMKNLVVASYENMGTPKLPIAFGHSTTLRTLCLRSCALTDDISFLGSLCHLETLSLVHCNIKWLPSAIGKLKKLKLIDLTGCVDLQIDPGVFQNLDNLEELYMRASKGRPVRFTQANFDELEKLSQRLFALELEFIENKPQPKNVSFKKLERFRISIGCELKNNERYSFRNTLNLVTECNELKEWNMGDLFKKTKELRLQVKYMIHLEDVSMHHTFSQLRFLHIFNCAELKYLFTVDVANGLKNLEQLTISECPVLEALMGKNDAVKVVTLEKLKYLSLEGLPKMVSLYDNVIELPEMVELRLAGLPNFTSIYPDGNTSGMQPLFNKEGMIPKLEKLDIFMMETLRQIWPCQISTGENNDVSMLRQITVRECDSLVNLFPRNPLPLLNHLEEVVVKTCGSLEVLFNIDFESVCEMGKHTSSRLRRIEVDKLAKLKELWRMRGTKDFDFLIDSFKGVKIIEISDCKRFRDIFTPTTTNFDLGALTSYISFQNGRGLEESDRKNKMIEPDQEEVNVTYPSYLLHTCHRLQDLELHYDGRVEEVVFDMDISPSSSRQSAAIQQPPQPLLLPHLESIRLINLYKMSHVWKCNNWNNKLLFLHHHEPPPPPPPNFLFPFQNLSVIYLYECDKIKYLFSPLMAKYLSNLTSVDICWCHGIEEVVSSRDDEENTTSTATSSHQINNTTSFFPHFDTLRLYQLPCLKRIDGEENTWRDTSISSNTTNIHHHYSLQSGHVILGALCQYPTKIDISNCGALSSLIPWYAVGQMKRLQELKIEKCGGMMEVFQSELSSNNVDDGGVHGTALTTPTLKNIPQLSNLKKVSIIDCELLPHIFTFSTIKTLYHLKELKVKRCEAMQVIVKLEETPSAEEVVVFPHLETLELDALPKLKGFFLGMNEFRWPSLVNVMINDCPQWVMLTSGQLETPKLKYVCTSFGKYSLKCGFNFQTTFPTSSSSSSDPTCNISKGMPFSFHDLIEINIENRHDVVTSTAIIPSHAIQQLHKLEQITIRRCNGIEEVFGVVALELELEGSGFNESLKIPNLTQLNLSALYDLKYLWKSNQRMVLEFPKLTTVDISWCDRLEHVFTCSMAGSLVQLQHLAITWCQNIEVIMKEEECDGKANEIMLPRLNSLKLFHLGKLKGFCLGNEAFSMPEWDALVIGDCGALSVFTKGHVYTPELKVIDTTLGRCDVRTDINSFIESKLEAGHKF